MTAGCRRLAPEDLDACAALYLRGFERGIRALFGVLPAVALVRDGIELYLRAEPEGCFVWTDGGRVDGYLLVTRSQRRLAFRAMRSPRVLLLVARLLRGRYGIARPGVLWHALREVLRFARHAGRFRTAGDAQIVSIAVRESARGAGAARRLMDEGLAYMERAGCREVRLEVQPDNEAARRLYRGLGFVDRGEIPSPLGRALVMTSPLPPTGRPGAESHPPLS